MNTSLRRLVTLLGIGVVLGLPGAVAAHEGGSFTAAAAESAAPTVDGVVGTVEWAGATPYSVAFGPLGTGTVRFLHAERRPLHRRRGEGSGRRRLALVRRLLRRRPRRRDRVQRRRRGGLSNGSESGEDLHVDDSGSSHNRGHQPTTPMRRERVDGDVMFELRHSLCSDRERTTCACRSGETVGLTFQYRRNSDLFFNAPPANSDLFDPSDWAASADRVDADDDTTPPEVTVTAPKAGDVVSGTITAAANASDNVGVTSVEFLYFDGAGTVGTDLLARHRHDRAVHGDVRLDAGPEHDPARMRRCTRSPATPPATRPRPATGSRSSNANVTGASISITGDPSALAGAASAPIDDIPVDAIRGAADDGPRAAPLAGIPLGRRSRWPAIPLGRRSRSAGIPLGGIGFTSTNLNQNGLGGVPLSSIPLNSTDGHVAGAARREPDLQRHSGAERHARAGPGDLRRHDADAGHARRSRPRLEPARRHPARRHRARRPAARRHPARRRRRLDAGREPRRLVRLHQCAARLQLHGSRTRSAARR